MREGVDEHELPGESEMEDPEEMGGDGEDTGEGTAMFGDAEKSSVGGGDDGGAVGVDIVASDSTASPSADVAGK